MDCFSHFQGFIVERANSAVQPFIAQAYGLDDPRITVNCLRSLVCLPHACCNSSQIVF
ncbi:MAG: hypothetical protein GPOALKHO_000824 [Sodalis sp.]|nr:MAG: hypothetical protein GPOALKHO_000824 [Sodalis sp.]